VKNERDVVIVGAPRSGTNMLRDVITTLPGFSTWPCDEINLTWRHGNRDLPSDELDAGHARPEVQAYVRRQFDRVREGDGVVVEKTCANSLRVEFVHRIVPDARFIFITRDGYDAAASAMQRWNAPLEIGYTVAKARWMPPSDIPYYGRRFVANLLRKRRASRSGTTTATVGWWGPKPQDWRQLSETRPLDEVCMLQWQRCVDVAERGLATVPADQVHRVSYEEFVRDPQAGLRGILDFLDKPDAFDAQAVADVSSRSVGKGRESFTPEVRSRLSTISGATMTRLGYAL
jgi:hypothetical protein